MFRKIRKTICCRLWNKFIRAPIRDGSWTKELAMFPRTPITVAIAKVAATVCQEINEVLTGPTHPLDQTLGLLGIVDEALDVELGLGVVHHVPVGVVDLPEVSDRNGEVLLLEVVFGVEVHPNQIVL